MHMLDLIMMIMQSYKNVKLSASQYMMEMTLSHYHTKF